MIKNDTRESAEVLIPVFMIQQSDTSIFTRVVCGPLCLKSITNCALAKLSGIHSSSHMRSISLNNSLCNSVQDDFVKKFRFFWDIVYENLIGS